MKRERKSWLWSGNDTSGSPRAALAWVGVLAGLAAGGCPLTHGDPAANACRTSKDCFESRGEYCEMITAGAAEGICRTKLDAAVPDRPILDLRPADRLPPRDVSGDGRWDGGVLNDGHKDRVLRDAQDR